MPLPSAVAAATVLRVTAGQYSDRGRKPGNQDFHSLCIPSPPLLDTKGIAMALADGISSSGVSHIASETAVASFLEDYYCTPETWSVKKSAQRVIHASNAWLHAQTRQSQHRHDRDRGYVCAMSVLVLKSTTAHLFHVGDARIFRLRNATVEQLTEDHRIWVAHDKSHLSRALGLSPQVEIDYHTHRLENGDIFILATDGVYEHIHSNDLIDIISVHTHALDTAAQTLAELAYTNGSVDNLTVQIVRVEALPTADAGEIASQARTLPCPPLLSTGTEFEGFRILDEIHASSRSHVYLAIDPDTDKHVAIKIPSLDLRHDPRYLERLLMEEWIARRIDSRHVVKAWSPTRPRYSLYTVCEYLDGITLKYWMAQHPTPAHEEVIHQHKLRYESALNEQRAMPAWMDRVLSRAVHVDPQKRYQELSEFVYALQHPHASIDNPYVPLLERNPLAFWKGLSLILAVIIVVLLALR